MGNNQLEEIRALSSEDQAALWADQIAEGNLVVSRTVDGSVLFGGPPLIAMSMPLNGVWSRKKRSGEKALRARGIPSGLATAAAIAIWRELLMGGVAHSVHYNGQPGYPLAWALGSEQNLWLCRTRNDESVGGCDFQGLGLQRVLWRFGTLGVPQQHGFEPCKEDARAFLRHLGTGYRKPEVKG